MKSSKQKNAVVVTHDNSDDGGAKVNKKRKLSTSESESPTKGDRKKRKVRSRRKVSGAVETGSSVTSSTPAKSADNTSKKQRKRHAGKQTERGPQGSAQVDIKSTQAKNKLEKSTADGGAVSSRLRSKKLL